MTNVSFELLLLASIYCLYLLFNLSDPFTKEASLYKLVSILLPPLILSSSLLLFNSSCNRLILSCCFCRSERKSFCEDFACDSFLSIRTPTGVVRTGIGGGPSLVVNANTGLLISSGVVDEADESDDKDDDGEYDLFIFDESLSFDSTFVNVGSFRHSTFAFNGVLS